jgi:DNA-binding beta-propeller fold protein YncE
MGQVGSLLVALGLLGCEERCPEAPGVACTYIGTGVEGRGPDGLQPRETEIYWALDLEFAPDGRPYFIDWNNHLVRRINADGKVETVIGGELPGDGPREGNDFTAPGVPGTEVLLNHPTDIQFDDAGRLLLMAWHNHKIRVFDPRTGLVYTLCGRGPGYAGDGSNDLSRVLFNQPSRFVRASDGTLYVLDQRNFLIRRIAPDGMVSTFAGTPPEPGAMPTPGFAGDGGPATRARFAFEAGPNPEPSGGLALDEHRSVLYVADSLNYRIRAIDLATGLIDTVVGTGEDALRSPQAIGDGGPGRRARLGHVRELELGPDGRLYFADTELHRIRAWDPDADVVTTVAGTGRMGRGVEGRPATEIDLNRPMGIAFGPDGALYVADTGNSRYLRIPR